MISGPTEEVWKQRCYFAASPTGHVTLRVPTLLLSALSCLNCNGPSFVASQKTSDEESALEPESSDERSS